jgi:hypothetical protein
VDKKLYNRAIKRKGFERRFWSKVCVRDGDECWEWTASKARGYGKLSSEHGGQGLRAHVVSWIIHFGWPEDGMGVCHTCDNPPCVNPWHLFLGGQKDNIRDASKKGRLNKKSLLNLCAGAKGFHGAGPINRKGESR